jgi:glucose-1-phosphate thymidylyltransferase
MKGIVLAGGLGTRLRPLTHTGTKQLIPIANKPVLEYCIEDLREVGIHDIGIIVGYTPERIKSVCDVIGDGGRWGVNIVYIEQDSPRGIAHAVQCAKHFVGDDDLVVYLGDNILKGGIAPFIERFKAQAVDAGILLAQVEDPRPYGVAVLNGEGNIIGIQEKPSQPASDLVIIGIYYFSSRVFDIIEQLNPSDRGEYEISDTLRVLIESDQYTVSSTKVDGWWDDTGTAEAVLRANHLVMIDLQSCCKGTVEQGARLVGNVVIGAGTVVDKGSVIRGPVIIGKNCRISYTYLGPYTSVGDNCVVRGGEIESSILIGDTTIYLEPHKRIVDSLIGRYTIITSAGESLPSGHKLIIGENSEVGI